MRRGVKPVGVCPKCGQEFMTKGGMDNHIKNKQCAEPEPEEPPRPRWRQVNRIGGGIGWVRDDG